MREENYDADGRIVGLILTSAMIGNYGNRQDKYRINLTASAETNSLLRMNLDLRNSDAYQSQRMLNAIESGNPMPIHLHKYSSETEVCLRGRLVEEFLR